MENAYQLKQGQDYYGPSATSDLRFSLCREFTHPIFSKGYLPRDNCEGENGGTETSLQSKFGGALQSCYPPQNRGTRQALRTRFPKSTRLPKNQGQISNAYV